MRGWPTIMRHGKAKSEVRVLCMLNYWMGWVGLALSLLGFPEQSETSAVLSGNL